MTKVRRHDLDALRVIVFGLLILYHVGMYFVPWGWHIKPDTTQSILAWPMLFLNQWRLHILFIISGMGTYFALGYRSRWQFIKERFIRLFVPLAFGILLIVPPQVYIERVSNDGYDESYIHYLLQDAFDGIYPTGNFSWHHLWFLPYLFLFSLIFVSLFIYIKNKPSHWMNRLFSNVLSSSIKIYLLIIPLYLCEVLLEPFFPVTHALVGDWFTIVNFSFYFIYGFMLMLHQDKFWKLIHSLNASFILVGIISFACFYGIRQFEDNIYVHFTEGIIKVFNAWTWILIMFSLAARYLNKSNPLISYSNRAVYPFYILHQTVLIILIYWISPYQFHWGLKFMLLSIGTFIICWVLYDMIIKRWRPLQLVFGLKRS